MTSESPAAAQAPSPSASSPPTGESEAGRATSPRPTRSRSGSGYFGFSWSSSLLGSLWLIAFFAAVRHWVALHTGTLHGGPDLYYNFWSGFGSDLGEATLISAVGVGVYTGARKVNCHTKGCWRIGHHALEGTPYILCRHHHPEVPHQGCFA